MTSKRLSDRIKRMKRTNRGEDSTTLQKFSPISVIRRRRGNRLSSIVWPDRFLSKIAIDKPSGCWNWTGCANSNPRTPHYKYGVYAVDGTPKTAVYAHRFAYEFAYGPLLLDALDVDHICQNKLCVNPAHLRAITHQDNCRLRRKRARVPGSVRWEREQRRANV